MSTERPEVAAAASMCGPSAATGSPLLAFPLQVEHRVVDADGEADQEHHRVGLVRHRQQVAGQRDQPERREHRRQPEQQRNACRHEGAEREQEDEERDREREHARLPQVVLIRRQDPLFRARIAEHADEEARMGALRGGDRVDGRSDLVDSLLFVAANVELDEHGSPVFRDRTAMDVRSRLRARETRATTSATAALKAGSPARCVRLWIRMFSPAGCLNPASRMRSIRPDSPGPSLEVGSMVFVPTMPPSAKATTTKASQPNVAVFQWAALQRPMRAARLRLRWWKCASWRFSFQAA